MYDPLGGPRRCQNWTQIDAKFADLRGVQRQRVEGAPRPSTTLGRRRAERLGTGPVLRDCAGSAAQKPLLPYIQGVRVYRVGRPQQAGAAISLPWQKGAVQLRSGLARSNPITLVIYGRKFRLPQSCRTEPGIFFRTGANASVCIQEIAHSR